MPAILAYFSDLDGVNRAKEILSEYGVQDVQIDMISKYQANYSVGDDTGPGTPERITGLSNVVQGTDFYEGAGILASADPAASGMAGPHDMLQHKPYLLTVVSDEKNYEIVRRLIEELGGFLGS